MPIGCSPEFWALIGSSRATRHSFRCCASLHVQPCSQWEVRTRARSTVIGRGGDVGEAVKDRETLPINLTNSRNFRGWLGKTAKTCKYKSWACWLNYAIRSPWRPDHNLNCLLAVGWVVSKIWFQIGVNIRFLRKTLLKTLSLKMEKNDVVGQLHARIIWRNFVLTVDSEPLFSTVWFPFPKITIYRVFCLPRDARWIEVLMYCISSLIPVLKVKIIGDDFYTHWIVHRSFIDHYWYRIYVNKSFWRNSFALSHLIILKLIPSIQLDREKNYRKRVCNVVFKQDSGKKSMRTCKCFKQFCLPVLCKNPIIILPQQ
jgi:hypothetical protein